jgi:hypothetical protein
VADWLRRNQPGSQGAQNDQPLTFPLPPEIEATVQRLQERLAQDPDYRKVDGGTPNVIFLEDLIALEVS